MDHVFAKKIIKKNNLIPREVSKRIINYINFDKNYKIQKQLVIKKYISFSNLDKLRNSFQEFKNTLDKKLDNRNFAVYKFIEKKYPNIEIKFIKEKNGRKKPILPEMDGVKLTLSSLLLGLGKNKISTSNYFKGYDLNNNFDLNLIDELANLFEKAKIKRPNRLVFSDFYNALIKGLNGEKLTIFSPVCPDYSAERLINDLYILTFKELRTGIGIVTKRLKKYIYLLYNFMKKRRIKFQHIIAVGDFEALSKSNLNKLKLNQKQFLLKVKKSQKAISKAFPHSFTFTSKAITEHFDGLENWKKDTNKIYKQLRKGNYGKSGLNDAQVENILESRKQLYIRWFGNISKRKMKDILLAQGAEYALMGYLINKNFSNVIVVGADHSKMIPFYRVKQRIPVVYLEKNYKTF